MNRIKKFGAVLILFVILAINFAPFLSVYAQEVDYQHLFTGTIKYTWDKNTKSDYVSIKLTTAHNGNFLNVNGPGVTTDFLPDSFILSVDEKTATGNITSKRINYGLYVKSSPDQLIYQFIENVFQDNKTYKLSFYYKSKDEGIGKPGVVDLLGNGKPYFLIASSPDFVYNDALKSSNSETAESLENQQEGVVNTPSDGLPPCISFASFSVTGCLANIVYYALFVPTSFIFGLTGQMLDFAIDYTTDSASYTQKTKVPDPKDPTKMISTGDTFITAGWKITRDLANIAFIFILLYTALGTILGIHEISWERTVGRIIIIALVINFSLFISRVVVDAGNVLARVFYTSIGTTDKDSPYSHQIHLDGPGTTKSVSVAIVSKFNPQSLFNEALKNKNSIPVAQGGAISGAEAPSAGWFTLVTLIMVILNCIGIYVFFVVGFLFLARTAGLWLLMIFAPFAFISYTLGSGGHGGHGGGGHGGGGADFLKWETWWPSLVKQSFVVPIFLFFLYLILKFLNTGFLDANILNSTSDASFGTKILQVSIPLLIITILLLKAKDIATEFSGALGQYAMKAATFVGGLAAGAATGGAALALSKTASSTFGRLSNENMKDYASGLKGNKVQQFMARRAVGFGDLAKNSSFDLRKTQLGKQAAGATGMNFDNSALSALRLGTEDTKGGSFGREARRKLDAEEKSKKYGFNQDKWNALDDAEKKNKQDFAEADEKYKKEKDIYDSMKRINPNDPNLATQAGLVETARHDREHFAHEGHEIHKRKEDVENERKNSMIAKEKKKAGITQPVATQDIRAPKDMTLQDGTRVRRGDVIVKEGQALTNSHLKSLTREMKSVMGENYASAFEKRFKQYGVKNDITYKARDAATGALVNRTIPAGDYSPKERDKFISDAIAGGASTKELEAIKAGFDYLNTKSTKTFEVLGQVGERALQGAGIGLVGGVAGSVIGGLGGAAFGLAEVITQLSRYSKGFAENLGRITNEHRSMARKSGGNSHAPSSPSNPAHDSHNH